MVGPLLQVRHCALSLVGEPIMYPEINAILTELHKRHISSFLVTNAQFPDRIRHLVPITQLYVSVDAATRDTLKASSPSWLMHSLCVGSLLCMLWPVLSRPAKHANSCLTDLSTSAYDMYGFRDCV